MNPSQDLTPPLLPSVSTTATAIAAALQPQQQQTRQLQTNIITPHNNDVLWGRGKNNPGNVQFREIVKSKKHIFNQTKPFSRERRIITSSIVQEVRNMNPPGRFLTLDKIQYVWNEIDDEKAREKVTSAFREKAPNLDSSVTTAASPTAIATVAALQSQQKQSQQPQITITTPHSNDVLSGRGASTRSHPGNVEYRKIIERKMGNFNQTQPYSIERFNFVSTVIQEVRNMDPPGRFLIKDRKRNEWHEIDEKKIRDKIVTSFYTLAKELSQDLTQDQTPPLLPSNDSSFSATAMTNAAALQPQHQQSQQNQTNFNTPHNNAQRLNDNLEVLIGKSVSDSANEQMSMQSSRKSSSSTLSHEKRALFSELDSMSNESSRKSSHPNSIAIVTEVKRAPRLELDSTSRLSSKRLFLKEPSNTSATSLLNLNNEDDISLRDLCTDSVRQQMSIAHERHSPPSDLEVLSNESSTKSSSTTKILAFTRESPGTDNRGNSQANRIELAKEYLTRMGELPKVKGKTPWFNAEKGSRYSLLECPEVCKLFIEISNVDKDKNVVVLISSLDRIGIEFLDIMVFHTILMKSHPRLRLIVIDEYALDITSSALALSKCNNARKDFDATHKTAHTSFQVSKDDMDLQSNITYEAGKLVDEWCSVESIPGEIISSIQDFTIENDILLAKLIKRGKWAFQHGFSIEAEVEDFQRANWQTKFSGEKVVAIYIRTSPQNKSKMIDGVTIRQMAMSISYYRKSPVYSSDTQIVTFQDIHKQRGYFHDGLNALLSNILDGRVGAVFMTNTNRISSTLSTFAVFLAICNQCRVSLHFAQMIGIDVLSVVEKDSERVMRLNKNRKAYWDAINDCEKNLNERDLLIRKELRYISSKQKRNHDRDFFLEEDGELSDLTTTLSKLVPKDDDGESDDE